LNTNTGNVEKIKNLLLFCNSSRLQTTNNNYENLKYCNSRTPTANMNSNNDTLLSNNLLGNKKSRNNINKCNFRLDLNEKFLNRSFNTSTDIQRNHTKNMS